ncbi:hypothetical protein [Nonomuraea sp. NPDC049695]|uniref:hypothetical protein n=1 Tax=Nonomuraea sp. NPDC049695 TaxID=3154734 RepID=UPI00341FA851
MFKRRLAVLGAVAVLAVTGLAGSAMADESPAAPGAKVTCKTADGKTITLPEIGSKAITRDGEPGGWARTKRLPEGETLPPDVAKAEALPRDAVKAEALPPGAVKVEKLPDGVKVERLPDGELPESVEAVPAQPAEPGDWGPVHVQPPAGAPKDAMKVRIICEKADQITP